MTWSASPEIQSKVGTVTTSWTEGISVSSKLWKAPDHNGTDVWICSASGTTQIRAAVDTLGKGHDPNGTRPFIADDGLISLGKTEVKALDDGSKAQIEWLKTQGPDIGSIIETLCIKTNADDPDNVIGIKCGFRNHYGGYHSMSFGDGNG